MTRKLTDDIRTQWQAPITITRISHDTEVAEVVAFLASPLGAYITGHTLEVDGGLVM